MSDESRLQRIYQSLTQADQASLLAFAEFLLSRQESETALKPLATPTDIPRPEEETVVGAIKRLKQTYPMIESMTVFSKASGLMTEHMVQGRDVVEVIDEMEMVFATAYEEMRQNT